MAKFFSEISPRLQQFIAEQRVFFTASAPLSPDGRINLSPKGMDTFRCLDSKTVAYLDLTGSGNETAAHVSENGRLTIMFCSFGETPLILRLYGLARVAHPDSPDWQAHRYQFPDITGQRQLVILDITSVQTSCGFGVPVYQFKQDRPALVDWADRKGSAGLKRYRHQKNMVSIDGLSTNLPSQV